MEDGITAIMVAITILALLPACYFDYRYRTIPNAVWWFLGAIGIAFLLFWTFDGRDPEWQYIILIMGTVAIVLDMLVFTINSKVVNIVFHVLMILCFAIPCLVDFDVVAKTYLAIGASYAIFYLLYIFGVLKGGADVKCLTTLAFMFPVCPRFFAFPMIAVPSSVEYAMPFAVVVLFHAAVITLLWLFWTVLRKVIRKNDPVGMVTLSCYTMSIEEARRSHVWAKQDVRDGMVVNTNYIPDEGVYDRLEGVGATTVWVTPIIPFIIPITVAAVFVLFVGNLLFIPFGS